MFMEATHWSCTAEAVMMMRTHNADSGFCYTAPNLGNGDASVDVLDVSLKFVNPVRAVACQCRFIAD